MDKLKVAKADNTLLQHRDDCQSGTIHLTQHHIIFHYQSSAKDELWIPHSLLALVTRLPSLLPLHSQNRIYPLGLRLRNFDSYALGFESEVLATDVFESVKACAVLSSIEQLYAFYYSPQPPFTFSTGWFVYDFKREFARQGVGSRTKAWRFSDINSSYTFCPTYPAQLVVPSRISDATLGYASKYRSKARIPALSYLHWANFGTITRSSQPMVGIKQNRSIQDEKLIEAIFTSHHFADPHSKSAAAAAAATSTGSGSAAAFSVYGATSTNLIIDARPTTNAMANVAKGAGTENMEHYKGCKKAYLGVDNIHVMRDSLSRLTEALRESEPPADFGMKVVAVTEENPEQDSVSDNSQTPDRRSPVRPLPVERPLDRHALKRSNWLKHISALLEGAMLIARNVHVNSSHVLIHCSDGWDRTAQLASLAEICLDPYYRTLEGFTVLIEKDWLSFGHRFYDRSGHLSSDKFFVTAPGHGASINNDSDDESQGGFEAQAANAFWGFTKQLTSGFPGGGNSHLKETSPVFHQFLDCVWQLHRQFPQRFEFSPALLCELHHHLYSCQFGTFLYNCERDRRKPDNGKAPVAQRTVSMWNAVLSDEVRSKWLNPQYDRGLDDPKREGSDMGVLFADPKDVQFFSQLFRRDHDEMNALVVAEAEERKRLKEADIAAAANNRGGGPNEVDGVVIGPAVEGQGEDPVLDGIASTGRHGTVDLSSLAYQPRTPRAMGDSRTMPRSAAASPAGRAIPPFGATATNGSPSADDPLSSPPGAAVPTAADAAARMKTLFLGGWARVQDAVSGGSAQSPQPSRAASPAHNHNPLGREGSHSPASRDFGGAAGNASRPSSAPRTISAGSLSNMERADRPPQRSRLDAPSGPQRSDLGFRDSSPFSDASTPSAPSASRHPDPVPSSSNPNPWAAPRSDPLAHSMVNPTELGSRSSKMSSSAQQGIDSDSTSANSLPRLSDQHPHQQQQQQQQPRMSTPDPSSTTTKKESAPGSASVSASASTAAEYDPLGVGL